MGSVTLLTSLLIALNEKKLILQRVQNLRKGGPEDLKESRADGLVQTR